MKLDTLLDKLQELGVLVLGAVGDSTTRPTTPQEWVALLGDKAILDNVKALIGTFQGEDFGKLAAEAEQKQAELEAGRDFKAIPPTEQAQSMALGNLAVVLRGKDLAQKLKQQPIDVLAQTLMPIIERVLPLVLTLI